MHLQGCWLPSSVRCDWCRKRWSKWTLLLGLDHDGSLGFLNGIVDWSSYFKLNEWTRKSGVQQKHGDRHLISVDRWSSWGKRTELIGSIPWSLPLSGVRRHAWVVVEFWMVSVDTLYNYGKIHPFWMDISTINESCSIDMLNYHGRFLAPCTLKRHIL